MLEWYVAPACGVLTVVGMFEAVSVSPYCYKLHQNLSSGQVNACRCNRGKPARMRNSSNAPNRHIAPQFTQLSAHARHMLVTLLSCALHRLHASTSCTS